MDRKACIVLGMHRSGTSALTRVLNLCGASLPRDLLQPQNDNPKGFWESSQIVALNEAILSSMGLSWYSTTPISSEWFKTKSALSFKVQAIDTLNQQFQLNINKNPVTLLIKDPRMCLLLPLWKEVFVDLGIEAHFILVNRHPYEVSLSLNQRDGFPLIHSCILWLRYTLDAERYTRENSRIFTSYNSLLTDWNNFVSQAITKFNINLPKTSDREAQYKINDFLDTSLYHSRIEDSIFPCETTDNFSLELIYELFRSAENSSCLKQFKLLNSLNEFLFYCSNFNNGDNLNSILSTESFLEASRILSDCYNNFSYVRRFMRDFQSELDTVQSQLDETRSELDIAQSQLGKTQIELDIAQSQLDETRSELDIAQSQLGKTEIESAVMRDELNSIKSSRLWKLKKVWERLKNPGKKLKGKMSAIKRRAIAKSGIFKVRQEINTLAVKPKFSIIMPVYNVEEVWLRKAIDSVRNQIYPNWELCIADDASTAPHIRPLLEDYRKLDSRIKVIFRHENGHISEASNSALGIATGSYIALLDNDDELSPNALFEVAKRININPLLDFIYSDEDKIDEHGNVFDPFFKPDWSPDYFHACMYTCHLGIYRKTLIDEIGGFQSEFDGAQDYDLVLRVVERTKNISHIPKVLYHWRIIPSSSASGASAKPWAYDSALRSLQAMIDRSPYSGHAEHGPSLGFFRVRRDINSSQLISIIIPTGGKILELEGKSIPLLENCIHSIRHKGSYQNIEFIIIDSENLSEDRLSRLEAEDTYIIQCPGPFNLSKKVNLGVSHANGNFLIILNDDTKIITPDWIESMLEFSQQEEIGAVGAKLLFPSGKIQHTGVVVLGGNPGHVFYGYAQDHPGYYLSNIVNRNYLAVTGACLMVRKSLFEQVNGFNEEFPVNYNDVDFCLKLHEAGYRNVFTPYTQLIHYESVTRDKGVAQNEWDLFNQKWEIYLSKFPSDPYYNPNLSNDAMFHGIS